MHSNLMFSDSHCRNGITVEVPGSISTAEHLQQYYVEKFHPPYWALNWSSFFDWMCDLQWISQNEITVIHQSIPTLDSLTDIKCYLENLNDCVRFHRERHGKDLQVIFPVADQTQVEELLNAYAIESGKSAAKSANSPA